MGDGGSGGVVHGQTGGSASRGNVSLTEMGEALRDQWLRQQAGYVTNGCVRPGTTTPREISAMAMVVGGMRGVGSERVRPGGLGWATRRSGR